MINVRRNRVLLASGTFFGLCAFSFQQPQIRVEVEAVNVLLTVTDEKGRFVTDLDRDRFLVYEDRYPQTLTHFSLGTDLPLKIALVIDTSSSIRLQLGFEKQAAKYFVHEVMRPQDAALLVEFDSGVTLLQDFTHRPGEIASRIDNLRAGGGTALLDAVYTVARDKLSGDASRKTMVILSDGHDRNSRRNLEEAIAMAQGADTVIYAISTTRFGASPDRQGEKMLTDLAEGTGGRVFFPYSSERLDEAFAQINQELRSQYSLTYMPANKDRNGEFRSIEVRIKDARGFKIRHKQGYFADPLS